MNCDGGGRGIRRPREWQEILCKQSLSHSVFKGVKVEKNLGSESLLFFGKWTGNQ